MQDQLAKDLIFTIGYIGQVAQNLRSGFLTNFNNIDTQYFGLGDRLNNAAYFIPLGGSNSGVRTRSMLYGRARPGTSAVPRSMTSSPMTAGLEQESWTLVL